MFCLLDRLFDLFAVDRPDQFFPSHHHDPLAPPPPDRPPPPLNPPPPPQSSPPPRRPLPERMLNRRYIARLGFVTRIKRMTMPMIAKKINRPRVSGGCARLPRRPGRGPPPITVITAAIPAMTAPPRSPACIRGTMTSLITRHAIAAGT